MMPFAQAEIIQQKVTRTCFATEANNEQKHVVLTEF